jgi:hypothetical protein
MKQTKLKNYEGGKYDEGRDYFEIAVIFISILLLILCLFFVIIGTTTKTDTAYSFENCDDKNCDVNIDYEVHSLIFPEKYNNTKVGVNAKSPDMEDISTDPLQISKDNTAMLIIGNQDIFIIRHTGDYIEFYDYFQPEEEDYQFRYNISSGEIEK